MLYNYYREVWLVRKLAGMLESAFDNPPYVVSYGGWGRAAVLMDGPGLQQLLATHPSLARPYVETRPRTPLVGEDPNAMMLPLVGAGLVGRDNLAGDADPTPPTPATDEWPLMYLRAPGIAPIYLGGLTLVALISIALIWGLAPREARGGFDGQMFFLGAAFMLLETRSLVTFALLFGSTWLVNSLVFFAILCSVLVAVFVSARWPIRPTVALYGLLLGILLVNYLLPGDALLSINSTTVRYAAASVLAFLPIFLANVVFASSFKVTGTSADVAFASNLLGIIAGGLLEYSALAIGYRHLLLLVIAFYVVSAILLRARERGMKRRAVLADAGSPGVATT